MDEEIDRMILSVRADTQGFAQDVETMRAGLDGPLASGADRAGRAIERSLLRAVQTGKFGFEDLRRVAMSAMDAIARDALRGGLDKLFGGGSSSGGGLGGFLGGLAGSLFGGAPGRATGGPVSPGRAYRVGERGPELFVPTSSGRVVAAGGGAGGRDVRVTINVNSPDAGAPQALARSARQIARNVRTALSE
ncbi:MAG: tail tape measure protein [Sphingobium sp.]